MTEQTIEVPNGLLVYCHNNSRHGISFPPAGFVLQMNAASVQVSFAFCEFTHGITRAIWLSACTPEPEANGGNAGLQLAVAAGSACSAGADQTSKLLAPILGTAARWALAAAYWNACPIRTLSVEQQQRLPQEAFQAPKATMSHALLVGVVGGTRRRASNFENIRIRLHALLAAGVGSPRACMIIAKP